MRFHRSPAFLRSLDELSTERLRQVERAIQRFVEVIEQGAPLLHGLGLKSLQQGYWEFRAGLADRIVLHRTHDLITFMLVGTHDDIRRFLRRR